MDTTRIELATCSTRCEEAPMASDKVVDGLQSAIDALTAERDEIDEKIQLLQDTLENVQGKSPRGRKKATARKSSAPKASRKKPSWSPEAKKAAAERMRKYWADRKKKEGSSRKKAAGKKTAGKKA